MTKRNRGPEYVGDILRRVIPPVSATRKLEAVTSKWEEVIGEELASMTRVVSFTFGTLKVAVYSSPLLTELKFNTGELLTELNSGEGSINVKNIKLTLEEE